jgi:plasmid maintenance system antidote protein VapI
MKFRDDATMQLPLLGGVVQRQRLHLPTEAIAKLPTYRHACRLAWKLRNPRNLTQRTLAEHSGAWPSHVSEYFSLKESSRELPARMIGRIEAILGNTAISQWVAQSAHVTLLEEMQANSERERRAA